MAPPANGGRPAAVLMLFGEDPGHGPDVLLMERASTLRDHAGQVAFPGGAADPGDADAVATALREADEETGLDPAGWCRWPCSPELYVPPSGFVVTPVIAHWERPVAVHAVDPGETAAVVRVPLAALADPANRLRVRHPSGLDRPRLHGGGATRVGFHRGHIVRAVGSGRMGAIVGHHSGGGPRRSMVDGAGRSAGGRRIMSAGPRGAGAYRGRTERSTYGAGRHVRELASSPFHAAAPRTRPTSAGEETS